MLGNLLLTFGAVCFVSSSVLLVAAVNVPALTAVAALLIGLGFAANALTPRRFDFHRDSLTIQTQLGVVTAPWKNMTVSGRSSRWLKMGTWRCIYLTETEDDKALASGLTTGLASQLLQSGSSRLVCKTHVAMKDLVLTRLATVIPLMLFSALLPILSDSNYGVDVQQSILVVGYGIVWIGLLIFGIRVSHLNFCKDGIIGPGFQTPYSEFIRIVLTPNQWTVNLQLHRQDNDNYTNHNISKLEAIPIIIQLQRVAPHLKFFNSKGEEIDPLAQLGIDPMLIAQALSDAPPPAESPNTDTSEPTPNHLTNR